MHKLKRKIPTEITPLLLILVSMISIFIVSRFVAYLVLIKQVLPEGLLVTIGGFRLHHFVYGNILIIVTSFLAIGLGIAKHEYLFAIAYGIGLGMVLDEFLLWVGDVNQLNIKTLWIPYSFTVISFVSLVIALIIVIRLRKLEDKK